MALSRATSLLVSLPVLTALGMATLTACDGEAFTPPGAEAPLPRPVQVAAVRISGAESLSAHTGVVQARRQVDLGFRAEGRITSRAVEVGQAVQAGQVLARLDPGDLALSLRAAEADLASAEAQARQARNEATRSRQLRAGGHVSASYDDQRQASARAAAEAVASARAGLELARNRLSYATLRAPSAGLVTALLAEAGQVVTEGQAVLRLADPAERELLVRVPEAALPGLAAARAEVHFWARPDAPLAATLREVAPQADAALRTYAARFSLEAAPDWVALGMTGTVRLSLPGVPAATLPLSALHDRGQGPMVWRLLPQGRIEAVPVTVLALAEQTVQVSGALQPGDQVVAMGPQLLDPGQLVRVVQTRLSATLR
ncbi:efflux RND transporter periplasmic adaptor subunit [Falsiroseomonas selenitidurans]|uniref:Efflux RND transporter periplasmic adaptor subunit n=1 Tax=Falsiroseomonas selenitidurans TaxID=2716335 RepID=A0ABX1DZV6_9PROT|nr:efflux RND transporter periplasmic adaptor subunit [Falsiroseomonas selenitidurans]NKC30043.1 efflux RND transporter periplasmic adaptor subunit [Falsiroseomonas selenitidurans]